VGVAELSAGRVAGARDAESMSRLGNYGDFSITFNLESLVLPDSQFHHFYTSSSRPIFGPSRRVQWCFVVGEGKLSQEKIAYGTWLTG